MALLKYFKTSLPTPKETEIGEGATRAANSAVSQVLAKQLQPARKESGRTMACSLTNKGQLLGDMRRNMAIMLLLRNSRVILKVAWGKARYGCSKKRYLTELQKAKASVCAGEVPEVTKIASKSHGLLGKLDDDVQSYLRALRKAGTPVSAPIVSPQDSNDDPFDSD